MTKTEPAREKALLLPLLFLAAVTCSCGLKPQQSIIGTWKSDSPEHQEPLGSWVLTFKADGTATQDIRAKRKATHIQETYTAQNGDLVMQFQSMSVNGVAKENRPVDIQKFTYDIDGSQLILSLPGKQTSLVFTRQAR